PFFISCFFLYRLGRLRSLHSFPTRRSSDLIHFLANRLSINRYTSGMGSLRYACSLAISSGLVPLPESASVIMNPNPRNTSFDGLDRKSTRLNSSHLVISYAVFCLKKKKKI